MSGEWSSYLGFTNTTCIASFPDPRPSFHNMCRLAHSRRLVPYPQVAATIGLVCSSSAQEVYGSDVADHVWEADNYKIAKHDRPQLTR